MSYIQIDNPIRESFAMVPDVLWSWPGLSFKAKGFFAYLLSFRHGACPPVAVMEEQTGLGRDARKAAMRELEAAGLARWVVRRGAANRIVAKVLEISTRPLLAAVAQGVFPRAPENPSNGENPRAPENPSDGKSVAAATADQAIKDGKRNKMARAEKARAAARSATSRGETTRAAAAGARRSVARPAMPEAQAGDAQLVGTLSKFQSAALLAGQTVLVNGVAVRAGSEMARQLVALLRVAAGQSRSVCP